MQTNLLNHRTKQKSSRDNHFYTDFWSQISEMSFDLSLVKVVFKINLISMDSSRSIDTCAQ